MLEAEIVADQTGYDVSTFDDVCPTVLECCMRIHQPQHVTSDRAGGIAVASVHDGNRKPFTFIKGLPGQAHCAPRPKALIVDEADIVCLDARLTYKECGTGAITIASAQRATEGQALGVGISKPHLDRAVIRAREDGAVNAIFLLADGPTHRFAEGPYDILVSRIGLSFFANDNELIDP